MNKLLSTTLQISLIAFSLFFITSLASPARALTLEEFISQYLLRQPTTPVAPAAPVQPNRAPESNTCENPNNPNNQCSGDRCTSTGRQVCSCVPYGGGWAYRYGSPESAWCNSDTNRGWCDGSSSKNANCGTGETCSGGTCSGTGGGGGGGGTGTDCSNPPGNEGEFVCKGAANGARSVCFNFPDGFAWGTHDVPPYGYWCDATGNVINCNGVLPDGTCEFGCGSPSAGRHACCTNAERDAGTCGTPKGGSGGGGGGGGGGGSTPTNTPVPDPCYYNHKGITAQGAIDNSVMHTGRIEGVQCYSPGVTVRLNSYYPSQSTAINLPEWPCTGEQSVGDSCTGVSGGRIVCTAGPAELVLGCFNSSNGGYREISRTPLATTPTPGSVTWPSYCGCQATAKALVPLADCGDNTMQCAPPVPDSRNNMKYVRRLENNQCYVSYYWCDSNGTPPAGNCGCDAVTTLDVTNNYPSEALCLGRNQMMAQCILPSSSYQQYSGFKKQWQNGRCVLLQYTCPAFSQPPMSLQVYAGEYMKMMRGRAFDPRIDVNGDNVRDLRDFYRLWQMWREQGTAHAPARAGEESGAVVGPIDM